MFYGVRCTGIYFKPIKVKVREKWFKLRSGHENLSRFIIYFHTILDNLILAV